MRVVIIGAGAAGLKAACRIRRRDESAEILVIDKEKEISLSRCSLPYYIAGLIKRDELFKTAFDVLRDKAFFKSSKNIEIIDCALAEDIDRKRKKVKINKDGSIEELDYDFLVIATGAKPVIPNIKGINSYGVFCLYSAKDADEIIKRLKETETVVIIGAGFIGLECCDAFFEHGVDIILVELTDKVLPTLLDYELAKFVESNLKSMGIQLFTKSRVDEIISKDGEVCAVKINNNVVKCQMVLLATGFTPNVELAKKANLEIGKTGAIKVNSLLQTSDPNIYAGGDCVECKCLITGSEIYIPSGSIANMHGRVIGNNITGLKTEFKGVLRSLILKVFDLTVGAIGLNEETAKSLGYDTISAIATFPSDKSHIYPERRPIVLKIVVDKNTKRVLGVQAVGPGASDKKLDVFASIIHSKMSIDDLMDIDFAYAPPYSPAINHVNTMGYIVDNKLRGFLRTIHPIELKRKLESDDDFIILDLRTDAEVKLNRIDDRRCIHIPFEKFRQDFHKIQNLSKEKEIILICSTGYRSYDVLEYLTSNGFKNVRSLEGGFYLFKAFTR